MSKLTTRAPGPHAAEPPRSWVAWTMLVPRIPMSIMNAIAGWRPRTPFYYGWLVLGTAAVAAFATTGIASLVLGGIQSLIFEDMGWDRSTIAFAVTAGTWTTGLISPFVGRMADRYGPRWLAPIAAIVVGVSFFALSGIQAVWHFYAAYIVARVIGGPFLVSIMPRTTAVNFFRRKRNLVIGLTSMFNPVGSAINIQAFSLITQGYSWRVAYRFLGVLILALVIPLFLIMRRRPEDIGLLPDGDVEPQTSASTPEARDSTQAKEFDWRAGEAARTPAFWFIVIAGSLVTVTSGAFMFQVVPYLEESGLSFAVAAGALSISSLLGAVANPGWGYLSDSFSPRGLALVALGATALVTLLFFFIDTRRFGFYVVILWGTMSGGTHVLGSMMIARYFGRGSFGAITGLMGPFQLVSLGLGPAIGAVLFNLTGGYTALFAYAVTGYTLALLLIYNARVPRLPHRAQVEGGPADD